MAGWALDASGPDGPDAPLAAVLLTRALCVAASIDPDSLVPTSPAEALSALDRSGVLEAVSGGAARAHDALAVLPGSADDPPLGPELREAERVITELLRAQRVRGPMPRRARLVATVSALVFVLSIGATLAPRLLHSAVPPYPWTASSAAPGFRDHGVLDSQGQGELLFHTDREMDPWIVIDLLSVRPLHSMEITNRTDCCAERCLPLVVEVAGTDSRYMEVTRRATVFQNWHVEFGRRQARYVRLRVDGRAYFHLREIKIL
jgi:hypothetical protein